MSRRTKQVLILTAMTLASILASGTSAQALTWTSNGSAAGTPFTATAPTSRFQIASTPTNVAAICTISSMTGKAYGPGPRPGTDRWADITLAFAGCSVAGLPATISCNANGVSAYGTSFTSGGVTLINYYANSAAFCVISVTALPGCTITLSSSAGGWISRGTYDDNNSQWEWNPTSPSPQTITAAWTAACTIFSTRPGSASATFGNNVNPPASLWHKLTSAFKAWWNSW